MHYTIRQIRLDRPVLIEFRKFIERLQEKVRAIEAELREADLSLDKRDLLLMDLEAVAGLISPPIFVL